jgi:hypothetical protein
MVRIRPPFPRPETCPDLDFEYFNTEGNSPDAVVYNKSEGIFTFKDKYYLLDTEYHSQFPSDDIELIGEVFLMEDYHGRGETLFVRYLRDENDYCRSANCKRTVLPNLTTDDKAKLTSMLNAFGSELASEAAEVNHKIKRMKTLMEAFSKDVAEKFPGFDFEDDLNVDIPTHNSKGFNEMEKEALQLMETASSLSADMPFSKKRKASD